jgi:O-antigen/teichoic acid export membrane protein
MAPQTIDTSTADRENAALSAGAEAGPPPAAAPASGWWRVIVDCAMVSGTTLVCHVFATVASLVFRMLLDPAQMGVWQGLKVFLSYSNYANLGTSKGATRDFTVALGRGDAASAQRGLNLAFAVNTLSSLAFAAFPVGAGLWVGFHRGWTSGWAVGLLVIGVLAVLQRHYTFQVTILRCKQSFALTSQVAVLEAVLTLLFCGLSTWLWGLWGMFGGTLAVMAATVVFVQSRAAVPLRWTWNNREIARLIAIGSPMLLAGVVTTLFRSLDKLMILGYLPDREFQLGCYSTALMVTLQLYGLANMLSIVMGPRYGETFGRSGSRREVARLTSRATELQSAAMALPSALSIVLAPALLAWLLPEYRSGLAPVVWMIPGNVALSMAMPASQYLVAVDQQGRALATVVIGTLLTAAANHLALTSGGGLLGVAAATALGYGFYCLLTLAVSLWPELDAAERFRLVAMQTLVNAPSIGLAIVAESIWPGMEHPWSVTLAKSLAVALAWGLTVLVGWRCGRWAEAVRGRAKTRTTVGSDRLLGAKEEFERRCQKPDHRRIGTWMARRITRPAALRITRLVAPWGVTANAATLAAWGCGVTAAAALAGGTIGAWLLAAVLLQLWYLLDHVDGQLARLRGTASLDGTQLDYLMHHTVNLLVPLGIGYGLFVRTAEPLWLLGGLVWGMSLLLITLQHDARYKAFARRLKRLRGVLHVQGGGGGRPEPQPPIPRHPVRLVSWLARKACETHVIMNLLGVLALAQWALGDTQMLLARAYLGCMAPVALGVTAWAIGRSQRAQAAEQEFAACYRVPPDCDLVFCDGWWLVEPKAGQTTDSGDPPPAAPAQSS